MTGRCFYYAPHHPHCPHRTRYAFFLRPLNFAPKSFFKNIYKNPLQFPKRFVIIYKSHG